MACLQIAPGVSEGCTRLVQKIAKAAESQATVDVHKYVWNAIVEFCNH